jgi:uncharacterized protein
MKTKNEILIFTAICLPLTWMAGLYLGNKGGLGSFYSHFTMYIPALTVLGLYFFLFKRPVFRKGDLGFRKGQFKYWLIAPALFTSLILLSYFISWLVNPSMFVSHEEVKTSLIAKGFYWGNSITGLLAIFLINIIAGSILNAGMFLGEELGWRGFLVPRLLSLTKPRYAFLLGGVIWGAWHMVMIRQGLNYPGHFLPGMLMMILFCTSVGIIIQYLYFRSGSIFVAVISHAAINKTAMSMSFLVTKDEYNSLLYGPTGLIGLAIFTIVAAWLYFRIDWKHSNSYDSKGSEQMQANSELSAISVN